MAVSDASRIRNASTRQSQEPTRTGIERTAQLAARLTLKRAPPNSGERSTTSSPW